MPYQLLFCLQEEDTGSPGNPALSPLMDQQGRARRFDDLGDAHAALNRLRRLADGLVYYVTLIGAAPETAPRQQRRRFLQGLIRL